MTADKRNWTPEKWVKKKLGPGCHWIPVNGVLQHSLKACVRLWTYRSNGRKNLILEFPKLQTRIWRQVLLGLGSPWRWRKSLVLAVSFFYRAPFSANKHLWIYGYLLDVCCSISMASSGWSIKIASYFNRKSCFQSRYIGKNWLVYNVCNQVLHSWEVEEELEVDLGADHH